MSDFTWFHHILLSRYFIWMLHCFIYLFLLCHPTCCRKCWKNWDFAKADDPGEVARQFMRVTAAKRRGYAPDRRDGGGHQGHGGHGGHGGRRSRSRGRWPETEKRFAKKGPWTSWSHGQTQPFDPFGTIFFRHKSNKSVTWRVLIFN